jgi:hypothetical protein
METRNILSGGSNQPDTVNLWFFWLYPYQYSGTYCRINRLGVGETRKSDPACIAFSALPSVYCLLWRLLGLGGALLVASTLSGAIFAWLVSSGEPQIPQNLTAGIASFVSNDSELLPDLLLLVGR